ncbi:S24 family peptidase [uncultured Dokdonia sp.]|uniref:S24 family peptidase n=1 Tax=uncultured Dokdonia sp. TaxID=575653 RepID=UPI002633627D|nr:S24 family peptidase [uncultured Dokdonia sp.]
MEEIYAFAKAKKSQYSTSNNGKNTFYWKISIILSSMKTEPQKVKRAVTDYSGNRSVQTGFPSPATHYREPMIDLNKELSSSRDATYFVRVKGDSWKSHNILDKDVLIIDRAQVVQEGKLALVITEEGFDVQRINASKPIELWGMISYIIHKAV